MKTNLITLIIGLTGVGTMVLLRGEMPWTAPRIAGAALGVASIILLIVARIQIGASFSLHAKAHALVTSGLYSRIRHPIYVFSTLMIAGIALYLNQLWLLLVLVVVIVPVQFYRARIEEQTLMGAFGEDYARYKASSWF
jgi:protein-S-isoprenylcysteine O-methyltransferase Ste14